MAATVRDLITDALAEIGVVAGGESPAYEDAAYAFRVLNRMVDQWAAEPLLIFHLDRIVWDLQSGVSEYRTGTPGPTPTYVAVASDGFDTTWGSGPPGWTSEVTGTGSITNDGTTFQAGDHSLLLDGGVAGEARVTRDFTVFSGNPASVAVYYQVAGSPAVSGMKVQCVETGHYLTSAGAWQTATAYAISNSVHLSFFLTTINFTVEDEALTGGESCTLRVTLENLDVPGVNWDTFSLTNVVEGAVIPSVPVPWLARLESVHLLDNNVSPGFETPLVPLTEEAWANVSQKDLESERPQGWFYNQDMKTITSDRGAAHFFGTLHLWPIPTGSNLQGVAYVKTQVNEFVSLNDSIFLPVGYSEMIVSNLALRLCPAFSRTPSPVLARRAVESKGIVKRTNGRLADLSSEAAALIGTRRGYDIRTG